MYIIENELLKATISPTGAELISIISKHNHHELLWQGDNLLWKGHAPILFPHCGRLKNDILISNGKHFTSAIHGFARYSIFKLLNQTSESITLRLRSSYTTKKYYPYDFVLDITFILSGKRLSQIVTVYSPYSSTDTEAPLPFSIGFHPGFILPLEEDIPVDSYEVFFEKEESPIVLHTPDGLLDGNSHMLFKNRKQLPITSSLFNNGSICLKGLKSTFIILQSRTGNGRAIKVDISDFPYLLLWGLPCGELPHFICIEPWQGSPDSIDRFSDFAKKPDIIILNQGESHKVVLNIDFI